MMTPEERERMFCMVCDLIGPPNSAKNADALMALMGDEDAAQRLAQARKEDRK